MAAPAYPVHVEASLDPRISRWLWLVKWLLAVPHYVLLVFLWMAFVVVSVVAFFSIAITGRYPPSLFEFNVGVLRWSWRVHYYTFGALATDQYPPFTLDDVPDYPAHLEIDYPERLSRGLVWVKWWLLAIPHYLIVAVFAGGGTWAAWRFHNNSFNWAPGGLIGLLVLVAAVVLLVTGRYPRQIFDFVLGLNRWVLRVCAYAALMTDEYPPFRVDMGGHEPGDTLTVSRPMAPSPGAAWPGAAWPGAPSPEAPLTGAPAPREPYWGAPLPPPAGRGWTSGRIASLVIGSVLLLVSMGLLAGGGLATWADNTQRDAAGFVTTGAHSFSTSSFALTSEKLELGTSADAVTPSDILGTVRLRVTPTDPKASLFVGIARQSAVNGYLAGVDREVVTDWASGRSSYRSAAGASPTAVPGSLDIWAARSYGTGTQTLVWKPASGTWTIVVMNAGAAPAVSVRADIGATLPDLGLIAGGLLAAGGVLLLASGVLILVPVIRAGRRA
ncbi:MAG TPA: DUF4389 domain-containing protein [Acidimicrobiales bacterium]|nr:DUF4389 domain-containing protein [Acidimicrobiales bacterium]